jgi:chromosome partitioning protein
MTPSPTRTHRATVIAVANQKGGVAKTTSVIHLGAAIAELGKRVLLVDIDSQGHVAEGFGILADQLVAEMSAVIEGSKRITDIIIPNVRPNLDLAPSNARLADTELALVNVRFRELKVKRVLEPVLDRYDYILIDCPRGLGLLTVNALIAAHYILIPMAAEYYSMLGVSLVLKTVQSIKAEGNVDLAVLGLIPTRNTHTVHAREVVERTRDELGNQIRIFNPPVDESVRFKEATGQGKTVFEIAPDIPGAQAYRAIAKEIVHG